MKILSTVALLLSTISFSAYGAYLGVNENGLHSFTIDLNLEPKERFKETAAFFKKPTLAVLDYYAPMVPQALQTAFSYLDWIPEMFQPEYYEEIKGMAEAMEIDPHLAIIVGFVNELTAFCTSTIVK